MARTVERPSPVPLFGSLVVKNGSQMCASASGGIPMPVSSTWRTTQAPAIAPSIFFAARSPRRQFSALRLLLLPQLAQAQQHTDRLRRWVRPNQPRAYDTPPTGIYPTGNDDSPALVQDHSTPDDRPPLVDDLLNYEHPLL